MDEKQELLNDLTPLYQGKVQKRKLGIEILF